ncbi:oligosaccharide flippase family protein [Cellulosimicrobium funkei]|nr:oligosaccharide flippase family protein [Cellulosimicrobium funkei]
MTLPYLTRVLGPDVYGVVVLLTAVTLYFQLFVEGGLNYSAAKRVVEERNSISSLNAIVGNALLIRCLAALVSAMALIVIIFALPILREYSVLAFAYWLSAVLTALVPDFIYRGLEKMGELSAVILGSRVLGALLVFAVVKSPEDVIWVPVSSAVASLVALLTALWFAFKRWEIRPSFGPGAQIRSMASAAFPYLLEAVASTAFGSLIVLFLTAYGLPSADLAFWGASFTLIAAGQSMYGPLIISLFPRMVGAGDWRLLKRILWIFTPAIVLGCSVVYLWSDSIILLVFGEDFAGAAPVLRGLLPVLVFSFPALLLGAPVLGTMGRASAVASTTLLSGATLFASIWLLVSLDAVTVGNIALLRSLAELILLVSRVLLVVRYRRETKLPPAL